MSDRQLPGLLTSLSFLSFIFLSEQTDWGRQNPGDKSKRRREEKADTKENTQTKEQVADEDRI